MVSDRSHSSDAAAGAPSEVLEILDPAREALPFFAVYGLIGALAALSQFGGIVLGVPIATTALLLYLQPVWTSLFGRVLLKETITFRCLLAIAIALAGALVLLRAEGGRR